jgi:hypothetical protein
MTTGSFPLPSLATVVVERGAFSPSPQVDWLPAPIPTPHTPRPTTPGPADSDRAQTLPRWLLPDTNIRIGKDRTGPISTSGPTISNMARNRAIPTEKNYVCPRSPPMDRRPFSCGRRRSTPVVRGLPTGCTSTTMHALSLLSLISRNSPKQLAMVSSRGTEVPVAQCPYAKSACFWLETDWDPPASGDSSGHPMTLPPESRQVIAAWPCLPRHIVRAVMALVESALEAPR